MSITRLMRNKRVWLLLGFILAALPLSFHGCGTEYDEPSTTQTPTALISPATLKAWVDAGLVNGEGYDRVLILNVDSSANHGSYGHIPEALLLDSSQLYQERLDGIAVSRYEIPAGSAMDTLIRSLGITGNTTLVFTGSSMLTVARAYFTFRYWGFPKKRLKLLDGLNGCTVAFASCTPVAGSYGQLYGLTISPSPASAPSTYSVQDNSTLRNDIRLSLSEMIDYAEGRVPSALAIDVRTPNPGSYHGIRGSTGSNYAPTTDYLVFEGRIRGAKALAYTALYTSSTNFYNSDAINITAFNNVGLDSTKTAYIYCRFGFMGSVAFFVLDGILGWPAAFYDGSWAQWGQMSGNASMNGQLAADSPWRTDIPSRSELIVYNYSSLSEPTFFGTGLNNLTAAGSSTTDYRYVVEIDSIGTPDTFRWSSDGGTTWTPLVNIDGTAQALGATGVTVTFAATTGHTVNDSWIFTSGSKRAVEQLTYDGNVCSARYNTDGSILNSTGGATACDNTNLNSSDTSGNWMESDDINYMKSGSGGSGGGGGGGGGGC